MQKAPRELIDNELILLKQNDTRIAVTFQMHPSLYP